MKKVICIVVCIVVVFLFGGCVLGNRDNEPITPTTKSAAEIEQENYEIAKNIVIEKIKKRLKNPESLQIHSINYKNTPPSEEEANNLPSKVDMNCKYVFLIDCSAQNGFGGMNRSEIIAKYYEDGSVLVAFEEDYEYLRYSFTYQIYRYVE